MKTSARIDYILVFIALALLAFTAWAYAQNPTTTPTPSPSPTVPNEPGEALPVFEIPVDVPPGFLPVKLKVKNPSGGTFAGSDGAQTPAPAATTTPPQTAPPIAEQRHDKVTGANLDAPNYVADQQKKAAAQSPTPTPTPTPTMTTKVVIKEIQKESDLPKVLETLKASGAYQVGYYQAHAGGPIQVKALYKVSEPEKVSPPTPTPTPATAPASTGDLNALGIGLPLCFLVLAGLVVARGTRRK